LRKQDKLKDNTTMDVEKIYRETKAELDRLNTEQAVRLEKIKTLASEFGFAVDTNLSKNVAEKKAELEKEKTRLEKELETVVSELERTEV
jgi:hypothetical protein